MYSFFKWPILFLSFTLKIQWLGQMKDKEKLFFLQTGVYKINELKGKTFHIKPSGIPIDKKTNISIAIFIQVSGTTWLWKMSEYSISSKGCSPAHPAFVCGQMGLHGGSQNPHFPTTFAWVTYSYIFLFYHSQTQCSNQELLILSTEQGDSPLILRLMCTDCLRQRELGGGVTRTRLLGAADTGAFRSVCSFFMW